MENIFFPSRDSSSSSSSSLSCGCAQLKFKIGKPPEFLRYLPAPPSPPAQLLIEFPELKQLLASTPHQQPKCMMNNLGVLKERPLQVARITHNSFMKSISSLISFTTPSHSNATSNVAVDSNALQISSLLFIILTVIVILIVFLLIFIAVLYVYLTLTKSRLRKQKHLVYLNSNSSNPSILKSSEWHQFYPTDSSLTDSTTTSLTKSNLNYSVELRQSSNDFKDQLFANNFLKSNEALNQNNISNNNNKPLMGSSAFEDRKSNSNLNNEVNSIRLYPQNGLFFPRRTFEPGFNKNSEQLPHYYESIPDFSQFYFDINSHTINQRNSPLFLKIEQLNHLNAFNNINSINNINNRPKC